jgi:hypothetical protein
MSPPVWALFPPSFEAPFPNVVVWPSLDLHWHTLLERLGDDKADNDGIIGDFCESFKIPKSVVRAKLKTFLHPASGGLN